MGCCENKSLQTEFLMFPEQCSENKGHAFDEMSIYSEGDDNKRYSNTTSRPISGINTVNSAEMAFLLGSVYSKSRSIILADDDIQ